MDELICVQLDLNRQMRLRADHSITGMCRIWYAYLPCRIGFAPSPSAYCTLQALYTPMHGCF